MPVKIPHLDYFRLKDRRIAEAFIALRDGLNQAALQANVDPTGSVPPPSPIQSLSVVAANGIFSISITDNSQRYKGLDYFVEISTNASFTSPRVIHLGATRTEDGLFLGSGNFYFRAYSMYLGSSEPSTLVYCTANPIAGGGAIAGPSLANSTGSGTASNAGTQGGSGFGKIPYVPPAHAPSASPILSKK